MTYMNEQPLSPQEVIWGPVMLYYGFWIIAGILASASIYALYRAIRWLRSLHKRS